MRSAAIALLLLQSMTVPANAQVIAPTGEWVTDRAGLLSSSEIQSLSAMLAGHQQSSSTQIVIIILDDLDGRDASSYAFELGESWGVGQSGVDNGIVLLVSVGDRQVFIATGYGVEASVPDVIAGRIVREIITPSFRQGRYFEGLQSAVEALIEATQGQVPSRLAESRAEAPDVRRIMFILFVIAIVMIVFLVIRRMGSDEDGPDRPHRRRRGRGWPYIIWGGGFSHGSGRSGGFGGGGGGFGGFSGGGGSFGGGGAGGGW
ncbi:MAG TPA: TPM domain-containing protein [Rhodothermales bacterium]|nr:TPM domain-containing protein [Rhodothermales bacterium]